MRVGVCRSWLRDSRGDLDAIHGFIDFMYIYLGFTCHLRGVGGGGTEEEDIP